MKKIYLLLLTIGFLGFNSCRGPEGIPGKDGQDAPISEVFELKNVNFAYSAQKGYNIFRALTPKIYASDNILIYRLSGQIDPTTPIWQLIPRTLFLQNPARQLDYDFDFSKEDFTIYAGGTYDLSTTPNYINSQTFRIVIVPGAFSNKSSVAQSMTYENVIARYHIDDSHVKVLN